MRYLLLIAMGSTLLAACTSTPSSGPAEAVASPPEPEVVEAPERAIPADSVYPLLVAEFAIRRQD